MHPKGNPEKPQGSLIAYMSGLVKQHGGINLAQGLPGFPPPTELLDELSNIIHGNHHLKGMILLELILPETHRSYKRL